MENKFLCEHTFHFICYLGVGLLPLLVTNFVFNFIRNCQFLFQSGHTILYVCIHMQHMSLYVCIARRWNQSILKENQHWISIGRTDAEAESSILWPPDAKSRLIGKDPDAGKDWKQEKGVTQDEMVGWHHWLNEYAFKQTLGDSEGHGSLACCTPRCRRE